MSADAKNSWKTSSTSLSNEARLPSLFKKLGTCLLRRQPAQTEFSDRMGWFGFLFARMPGEERILTDGCGGTKLDPKPPWMKKST
jgi:hypothetical protein